MAPVPRLPEDTVNLISSIERKHKDLLQGNLTKLRRCTGPLSLQQSLAEDVREDTLVLKEQIEELDLTVDDLQGEKNRKQLRDIVDDFKKKLESLRQDTRSAVLASKKAIDSNAKSNKEELLAFSTSVEKQASSENSNSDDALMKANYDVTDALRRTISLMETELKRSVLSTQLLDESTASLRSTSLRHDTLSSLMSTSKQLVTALEKTDWLDRMIILSAFFFFVLVVLFILKQRIVDRGLRIAFWWTRFLPNFSEDTQLLKNVEKFASTSIAVTASLSSSISLSLTASAVSAISSSTSVSSLRLSSPSITSVLQSTPAVSETLEAKTSSSNSLILAKTEVSLIRNPLPTLSVDSDSPELDHVEL